MRLATHAVLEISGQERVAIVSLANDVSVAKLCKVAASSNVEASTHLTAANTANTAFCANSNITTTTAKTAAIVPALEFVLTNTIAQGIDMSPTAIAAAPATQCNTTLNCTCFEWPEQVALEQTRQGRVLLLRRGEGNAAPTYPCTRGTDARAGHLAVRVKEISAQQHVHSVRPEPPSPPLMRCAAEECAGRRVCDQQRRRHAHRRQLGRRQRRRK
eukprot:1018578-Pleurochrysis_carterae.AAC.6